MTSITPSGIGIPPWETYIAYSTNPCTVGHSKTTGVILNPDFWDLYQYRHPLDLTDGRYYTFSYDWCHVLEPRVAKDKTHKTVYLLKYSVNMVLYVCLKVSYNSSEGMP